jgi:hypothetical protein
MRRSVAAGAPLARARFPPFLNAELMLAQILMLRSRANAIETSDHRAQYVACLFFSRLLEGS